MKTLVIAPRFVTIPVRTFGYLPTHPSAAATKAIWLLLLYLPRHKCHDELMTLCCCNWYTEGVLKVQFTCCFNMIVSESKTVPCRRRIDP